MSEASAASEFAVALLAEFVRLGVRDAVVCPGSRSQALALAAAAAEDAGALRLHVRTDERSAGFFALGVARETGLPAPVIVTSGTAVANLVPAALEAHEGRVPLLLLTADRPVELRGIRSNQTTVQHLLFDGFARLALDVAAPGDDVAEAEDATDVAPDSGIAAAAARATSLARRAFAAARGVTGGSPAGPVQLNLAFREPLSGALRGGANAGEVLAGAAVDRDAARAEGDPETNGRGAATDGESAAVYTHDGDALAVVIAGEGAGLEAEEFARAAGLPLLAEVVSGVRFGREAISAYAALLDDPQIGALTERAIVFGHPTLTRQIPALLRRADVEVVVVDPHAGAQTEHYNPSGDATVVASARVSPEYNPSGMRRWLGAWVAADRQLREQRSTPPAPSGESARAGADYKQLAAYARAEVAALRSPVTREQLAEGVWRATWPHDRLVLAASRLVRVLDGFAPPRRIEVRANRGLAGIDGTVATALGIACASQAGDEPARAASVTRVLLGDLALLHDVGSLLLPEGEARPRVQLLVGNDGGGTIFDTLEAAGTAPREAFDRVMYTPQQVGLEHLAAAYGWEYRGVTTRGELDATLKSPVTGPMLVEVRLQR